MTLSLPVIRRMWLWKRVRSTTIQALTFHEMAEFWRHLFLAMTMSQLGAIRWKSLFSLWNRKLSAKFSSGIFRDPTTPWEVLSLLLSYFRKEYQHTVVCLSISPLCNHICVGFKYRHCLIGDPHMNKYISHSCLPLSSSTRLACSTCVCCQLLACKLANGTPCYTMKSGAWRIELLQKCCVKQINRHALDENGVISVNISC